MEPSINADRRQLAAVDGGTLPWMPSPVAGVDRRMLERIGGEVALATTLVRYAPGSRFPSHSHELGEEFLVLDGTFSDQSGDYGPGSYVRNPPGSHHAPFSADGCVILVKLRQMGPDESDTVRVDPVSGCWREERQMGIRSMPLYSNARMRVQYLRLDAGAELPPRDVPGGEEIFVVEGSLWIGNHDLGKWGWRRSAEPRQPAILATEPALLWVKRGHL